MSSDNPSLFYVSNGKGYGQAGASHTKRAVKGFTAQSGSPQEDIDLNNYTLRQRGRILYMSQPIATSAVKTNRTNVIGIGLKLNPKINREFLGLDSKAAEEWQNLVKMEFALWADKKNTCDATGMNNFYSMQQLALMSWLMSGDVFALRKEREATRDAPYKLRIQLIEADRCSTPGNILGFSLNFTEGKTKEGNKIHDGVEVGEDGFVEAYHFRNTHPHEMTAEKTDWVRVKAYGEKTGLPNVIHIMNAERPEQYRGVTYLAQIIEPLLQLRRYTESTLVAAVIQSFFTAFITTNAPTDMTGNPIAESGRTSAPEERYDPNEYEMGAGNIVVLNEGEDVKFAEPKHPAAGFDTFVDAICTQIGAALEIPKDLIMKEFNASYSASRAALLEAWKSFKTYRTWFADDFCNPVYELWLSEAVAAGRVKAPGFFTDPLIKKAWLGCEWIGPSQGQLDPVKEVTAEILAVQHGFTTHEDATMRLNGGDWNNNMDQLEREFEKVNRIIPQQMEMPKIEEEKEKMKIRNGPTTGGVTGILENQTAYDLIENEEDDSAEITMYGEVVKDRPRSFWTDEKDDRLYIVLNEFLNDLEKVKNRSKLTIRINSPGGDLYAGLAIMNRLLELKGDVITIVDGLAASAASIILQGGKKRKVCRGSMVMIHGASTFLFGTYNAAKLEEAVKQLDAANRVAAEAYIQRTGIDKKEIQSIMTKTNWMTGQETVDKGFADEVIDNGNISMSISPDNAYMSVNGIIIPTSGFETLPNGLKIDNHMVIPGHEPDVTDKNENKGGNAEMTAEEMRAKYPDVVAEIEKNAVTAKSGESEADRKKAVKAAVEEERKRISEIDEIANMVGDKELLKQAKFENPMTAAELALEAMRQQAKLGEQFMKNSQDDVEDSGVEGVSPMPAGNPQSELEQNDIMAGAALLAGIQEGGKK